MKQLASSPQALGELHWTNKFLFPKTERLSYFGTFSPAALGFLAMRSDPACDLECFSVKIRQLSPTSFLEVSKFIWIMKTFGRTLSVDAFARFFELVIVPDIIKVDDGKYYEAQHACCTFNTGRRNT
jgi:hypothetical protein